MATNFVAELDGQLSLHPSKREEFYDQMKHTVYTIYLDNQGDPILGGGMCVNADGIILTSYRLIGSEDAKIEAKAYGHEDYHAAKCIHHDKENDLALLMLTPEVGEEDPPAICYVDFCKSIIKIGSEALYISHTNMFEYSFTMGHVAFPIVSVGSGVGQSSDSARSFPLRTIGNLHFTDRKDAAQWKNCRKDLPLLQINNIHGNTGTTGTGSPVFGSDGKVIGMRAFDLNGFDFAIPADILEKYVSDWSKNQMESSSLKNNTPSPNTETVINQKPSRNRASADSKQASGKECQLSTQSTRKKVLKESKADMWNTSDKISGRSPNQFWRVSPTVTIHKIKALRNRRAKTKEWDSLIDNLPYSAVSIKETKDITKSCCEQLADIYKLVSETSEEAKDLLVRAVANTSGFRDLQRPILEQKTEICDLQELCGGLMSD